MRTVLHAVPPPSVRDDEVEQVDARDDAEDDQLLTDLMVPVVAALAGHHQRKVVVIEDLTQPDTQRTQSQQQRHTARGGEMRKSTDGEEE